MGIDDFRGRNAFITGAASGLGLSIAEALIRAGASVMLADIDEHALSAAVVRLNALGDAHGVVLDVTSEASWADAARQAADRLGNVHLFVSNAGIGTGSGLIEERSVEDLDAVWGVNARGMYIGVRTMLPAMKQHGQPSHVVLTASVMGLFCRPGSGIYSMSKYAVVALGETLFLELRGSAIGVTILCPGAIATGLVQNVGRHLPSQLGQAANQRSIEFLAKAAPADAVAAHLLASVRAGDLYALSHPEYAALVADRYDTLQDRFGPPASTDSDDLSFYPTYSGKPLASARSGH